MRQTDSCPDLDACHTACLPNGLRVVHRHMSSPVVYCGFAVDAGTRDEDDDEPGMAHFVEHLLFKGTRKRRAWHILNRMENVGGDLNAYTNKEETVVYCACLRPHLARAAELLTDIVFGSTFPQREIERETEVILDEIQSYEDSPAELIFDDFDALLFEGHALGRNILGDPARLRLFDTARALRFTARFYRPERMVFFVQGDVDFGRTLAMLRRLTDGLELPPPAPDAALRTTPPPHTARSLTLKRDTHQAHVMMGSRAYAAGDPRRTALCLLNNLLGGPGMNSRLNVALRERRGLVYNVECNLSTYTDAGTFSIYFGCDTDDADRCIDLTLKELRRLRDVRLTPAQLAAAQKQLTGQLGVAADNHENTALDLAKLFLHYGRTDSLADTARRIAAVTPQQVQDVAAEVLDPQGLFILQYR